MTDTLDETLIQVPLMQANDLTHLAICSNTVQDMFINKTSLG